MGKALNQELLGIVEDIYVQTLKKKYTGYRNRTYLQFINHPKTNYYNITLAYLKLNTERMNNTYKIKDLFKTIINQIKTAVEFSDSIKVPYIPEQVMITAYDLIFVTDYFNDACRRRNKKPAVDKTWEELQISFAKENCAWKDTHPTSAGEGGSNQQPTPRRGKQQEVRNYERHRPPCRYHGQ